MNPTASARGLVRPSYRSPGQAEYRNTDKLELDLEKAELEIRALKIERDQAMTQVAAREQTIARLKTTVAELNQAGAAARTAQWPGIERGPIAPIGRLSLDLTRRALRFGDRLVPLSRNEARIAALLFSRSPDVLITAGEIAAGMPGWLSLNSIRSYVWRIRGKLESVGARGYLNARHGGARRYLNPSHGGSGGGYWLTDPEAQT